MEEYKLLVRRIGLVGIANLLVTLSSLILIPILTKNFSIDEYGIWVQFTVSIALIPNIATLGLYYSMMRFLPAEEDKDKIKEGVYSIFTIVLITSFVLAFIFYLIAPYISNALFDGNMFIALIMAPAVVIVGMNTIVLYYFITFQNMRVYSIFLLIQTYLAVLFVSYFSISGFGISFTITAYLLSYLLILVVMIIFIVKKIGFKIPQFTNVREYLYLSLPTIPNDLSFWVVDSIDRYFIGIILGTAFVGYYSPSYTLGKMVILILTPISIVFPPILAKYYEKNQLEKVRMVLAYSIKYFLLIAIPFTIIISLLSEPILMLLTTNEIAVNGYVVTPFVVMSLLFFGLYSILSNIIILKKKTKIIGIIWIICAGLNILINLALIPSWGIIGAALATLVSYGLAFLFIMLYSVRQFKINFNIKFIAKSLIATLPIIILISFCKPQGFIELLTAIFMSIILYLMVLFVLNAFEKEEIIFIKNLLIK
ncbi:MAG: polysaccharide biosynthesis C-terminal domain-containing protein [Methanobacterium formicicum]